MKSSTYTTVPPGGEAVAMTISTAPDTSTVQTITPPKGISGFLVSVATTDANVTFNGSDPTAGTGVHTLPHAQMPALFLVAPVSIKAVSTASANAVISITWLY